MNPEISVIIPCYNSFDFLREAIESAEIAGKGFSTEIIIVDDGSTDENTLKLIDELTCTKRYKIVQRENGGPAAARNSGVKISSGKYLLFLDSDNRLRPDFISLTLPAIKSGSDIGVVYGDVDFFGDHDNRDQFKSGPYDIDALINSNYIDVCSLVRREALESVQGFDESRAIIGFEDWELWVHISSLNWKFIHLSSVIFDYRLRDDSVLPKASSSENYLRVKSYIYKKHSSLVMERFNVLYHEAFFYRNDRKQPFRSFFKYLKIKYLNGR